MISVQYYLVVIWGDVEADIHSGPYDSEEDLDGAALALREKIGPEDDGIHWLRIEDGVPYMGDWSGAFFEEANEKYTGSHDNG